MRLYRLQLTTADGELVTREIKAASPEQAKQLMTVKFPGCSHLEILDTREQSPSELSEEAALLDAPLPLPTPPPGKSLARARLGALALAGGILGMVAVALFTPEPAGSCLVCWIAIVAGSALLLWSWSAREKRRPTPEDRGPRARKDAAKDRRR